MIENSAVAGLHEQGSVESDAFRELRPEVSIYIYIYFSIRSILLLCRLSNNNELLRCPPISQGEQL